MTPRPVSSFPAAAEEAHRRREVLRLGELVGRELVLVLVVVTRVAAAHQRLGADRVEDLLVVVGEREVDHGGSP
jgi:hypothetical protein